MEVEFVTDGLSEDEIYTIHDNSEDFSKFEGERCGICMDIVIDRGVLDCCQHWFCFTCIDNWATITNLCPLCQNEFQSITCVPVYDTTGSNRTDDDIHSRDNDWCIDEKNDILSSPSYYIDENAVVCLYGDGCKIRSGSAAVEEDSNLDTSIACDSCDNWYHAFCVEFDTESTFEDSWLCPRCLVKETPKGSDRTWVPMPSKEPGQDNTGHECLVGSALAGRVSVSVADVGETALVVSMVERNQENQESGVNLPDSDYGRDLKVDAPLSCPVENGQKLDPILSKGCLEPNLGTQGLENKFFLSSSNSLEIADLMANTDKKLTEELRLLDGLSSSRGLSAAPSNDKMFASGLDLHLGLSVGRSSSAVDLTTKECAENQMPGYVQQKNGSGECCLPAEKVMDDKMEMLTVMRMLPNKRANGVTGAKRKDCDSRDVDDGESKAKNEADFPLKKVKAVGESQDSQLKDQADESGVLIKISDSNTISKDERVRLSSKKESVTNILEIVQETGRKRLKQLPRSDPADISSKEREKPSGLRVKKIMRGNDKDRALVVQKLRKEIREAVRNKSSEEIGEHLFDPKLLAAFRAVVAGQTTETRKIPVDLKAKKSLLQKGRVREHLTKKIYGVGGKRKRDWTRDCEIEFWKYRCSKASKPEKVQTLKSVLDLLRNDSNDKKVEHGKEGETSTFLSRLYLADTSVFPRKDDIKPVLVRGAPAALNQNKDCMSTEKDSTPSSSNLSDINLLKNKLLSQGVHPSLDMKVNKKNIPDMKREMASSTSNSKKCSKGPPASTSVVLKTTVQKESLGTSDNVKSDKRKWAMELLARKTASVSRSATQEKEEDVAMLKGNYPLLAQLPKDMRPELAPSRHNKIPASIRQAQLYRIAEHFLRRANLPVVRRTAESELAIADAINIEKEIADRSSSKPVYVNLCSQELLRRTESISVKSTESNPSTSEVTSDNAEASGDHCNDLVVDEALKAAGLLSDSPPGSPGKTVDEIKEEVSLSEKIEEDGPDNVFEVDNNPEFDIYGDFEYSLEDDDFIGASALKVIKPQTEDSKLKLVLSTVNNPNMLNSTPDVLALEKSPIVEVPEEASGLADCHTSFGGSAADNCKSSPLFRSSTTDGGEEPSLVECEELYGPDKEPLIQKYPEAAPTKPYDPLANGEIPVEVVDCGSRDMNKEQDNENAATLECPPLSENSSSHSQRSENASGKEKPPKTKTNKSDSCNFVAKKVEAYIKEHIRPLCKSGVITVEQYRWAVGKTTEKVMKYHPKDKNANFLIKEGEKVKKLAEQYVEAAQQMPKDH